MTNGETRHVVVASVLGCMVAVAVATAVFAASFPDYGFGGGRFGAWFLRLYVFDISTEVLVLGAIGYALPRHRLTILTLRVAAGLAVIGVATEVLAWIAALDSPFANISGGAGARAVMHLADLAACVAVIAAWYVSEQRASAGSESAATT